VPLVPSSLLPPEGCAVPLHSPAGHTPLPSPSAGKTRRSPPSLLCCLPPARPWFSPTPVTADEGTGTPARAVARRLAPAAQGVASAQARRRTTCIGPPLCRGRSRHPRREFLI
jgi:hypothetical protein